MLFNSPGISKKVLHVWKYNMLSIKQFIVYALRLIVMCKHQIEQPHSRPKVVHKSLLKSMDN